MIDTPASWGANNTQSTDPRRQLKAALLGRGIGQSKTPLMHQMEGRATGLDYSYHLIDVDTAEYNNLSLKDIIGSTESQGYCGLNVTHPYKTQVVDHLHELSLEAKLLGAVNTVLFRDGLRVGHNTDYSGFKKAFQQHMADVDRSKVLLLGAGGAGAAVAFALIDNGVQSLAVYDTALDNTLSLINKLTLAHPDTPVEILSNTDTATLLSMQGIVNTTPMGMDKYPGTAMKVEDLRPDTWVADIVYFPLETELLKRAKAHGCRTMNGSGMAIHQAVDSFWLLTGVKPDPQRFTDYFDQLNAASHPRNTSA